MQKNLSLGEVEGRVLSTASVLRAEVYGVSILDSLQTSTGKKFSISAIHIALKRLEDKGFVKSYFGGTMENRGGRRMKFYVIPAFGKRALDEQYGHHAEQYQQVPKMAFSR
jgi:DNA-binding PadR family transcriptional regulator